MKPGKKSYGSESPWCAKAENDDRTEQPVVGRDASHESVHHQKQFVESLYSARYSGWDNDKVWLSQEWKADEFMGSENGDTRCRLLGMYTRVPIKFLS